MDHLRELIDEFSNGESKPFELFATKIAKISSTIENKNELAILIFRTDWSNYVNERNGKIISMKDILKLGRKMEIDHINFMTKYYANHDITKDDFYILLCCLRFRYDFDTKSYTVFVNFFNEYIANNHYALEAHHPEYEKFGGECTLDDVTETAIDRMSRHFQFGGGKDIKEMNNFKPSWIKNNERNLKHYNEIILDRYESIGKEWKLFIDDR